ncbi:hypothetical protein B0J14DRAFT_282576 [Halenospora varia]|nr:hypothetical protein B0J14DRAFT_282576 [Halenospora varia]
MALSLSSNLWYQLSNNYTGSASYLAASSINGALFMSNSTSTTTQWQFLDHNNHTYSIKNQAAGSDFQLGIEYGTPTDRIIARPVLQTSKVKTQSQQWVFLPEEDAFTVANVQLGNIFFLDLLGDTLEPCMDAWGDIPRNSGQLRRPMRAAMYLLQTLQLSQIPQQRLHRAPRLLHPRNPQHISLALPQRPSLPNLHSNPDYYQWESYLGSPLGSYSSG